MNASQSRMEPSFATHDGQAWTLAGKNVLLISPQSWTGLTLSKHQIGARVFFLNPPAHRSLGVRSHKGPVEGITLLDCGEFARGRRFLWRSLYEFLERIQVTSIESAIRSPIDILWSFDPTRFNNLRQFRASMHLFHAADVPEPDSARRIASTADAIVGVSESILAEFPSGPPKRFVNHGLSAEYESAALRRLDQLHTGRVPAQIRPIQAGYVGNLLHPAVDHATFGRLIDTSPDVEFHFWGPTAYSDLNWNHPGEPDVVDFIAKLRGEPNVRLHGLQSPSGVADGLSRMNILLACYDALKDRNLASNSHKILEYLSTGKPVVSNRVSTYVSGNVDKGLVMMPDVFQNDSLPDLFRSVVSDLERYSSADLQIRRIEFALQHTYLKQLRIIDEMAAHWLS